MFYPRFILLCDKLVSNQFAVAAAWATAASPDSTAGTGGWLGGPGGRSGWFRPLGTRDRVPATFSPAAAGRSASTGPRAGELSAAPAYDTCGLGHGGLCLVCNCGEGKLNKEQQPLTNDISLTYLKLMWTTGNGWWLSEYIYIYIYMPCFALREIYIVEYEKLFIVWVCE